MGGSYVSRSVVDFNKCNFNLKIKIQKGSSVLANRYCAGLHIPRHHPLPFLADSLQGKLDPVHVIPA